MCKICWYFNFLTRPTLNLQHLQPTTQEQHRYSCLCSKFRHILDHLTSKTAMTLLRPTWPAIELVIQGWKTRYPISYHPLPSKDCTHLGASGFCVQWTGKESSFLLSQAPYHSAYQKSRTCCFVSMAFWLSDMLIWQHHISCFKERQTRFQESTQGFTWLFDFWSWLCKVVMLPLHTPTPSE